mgnify:CR=1 FL=1
MTARFPAALTVLALAALPLGACGGGGGGDDDRTASGEVLEGTISDAMLPLDTVTSEPPLMKTESPKAAAGGEAEAPGEEGEEGAAQASEAPATPAATATATQDAAD